MNTLIFILVTLAVALGLGLVAMQDPGYVLISRSPYEIEISLALFLLLTVLLFAGLYLLVRMLLRTFSAKRDLHRWRVRRQRDRAGRDMLKGYTRLIEGDFAEAERELTLHVENSDTPLLNHLGAAYAAQQQGDYVRRDRYLDQAAASGRGYRDAIALTRARLEYQAGQLGDARATIDSMPSSLKKRRVVERMEAEVLRSQNDFDTLQKRLPLYRRHNSFEKSELADLERQTFAGLISHDSPPARDSKQLGRVWSSLPKSQRADSSMVLAYAGKLAEVGNAKQAADQILVTLHHHWDSELVPRYAALSIDRSERIRQLKVWLEQHPDDARLLYCLAHLENEVGEREVAQKHYAEAIRHGAPQEAYLELGALLERAGESAEAMRCYRRGLEVRAGRTGNVKRAVQSSTANSKES
ncbi:MAG: heme biosynthesis protein HemY [marine bacterium B5-7]|nr:MAG: heme biosynthesis protein HemY [marine bacterium B5-7]